MTEVPSRDTQLDRIEASITQVLDRLTRMEERQNNHAGQIEGQAAQIAELSARMREVELNHAVAATMSSQQGKTLLGRWAIVGATMLVLLGAAGSFVGNVLIQHFRGWS
ncbi:MULTISPECIES: hypothetical protein [Halomonadaceae]|uniref:DUF1515 domain-containing protein n=1 Tax=Vreelandella titanicae TaxID=664683 RepID=A0AAP9T0F9_9GAMM|nr:MULTISPECIES: hypothetical protein [Halomonas]QKS24200.1 hypothetical protein FX987_01974 [Halomonas titanicae]CDG54555.1 hypothetical protein HALA3H3_790034 [Halomonas sp. A3H3]